MAEAIVSGLMLDPEAVVSKSAPAITEREAYSESEQYLQAALKNIQRGNVQAGKRWAVAAVNAICREHGLNGGAWE